MEEKDAKTPTGADAAFSQWLFGKKPKRTLVRLVVLIGVFFIAFKFFLIPVRVTGNSMEISYRNGEINFVLRTAYKDSEPKRGDVVAVWLDNRGLCFLKRVVALPGEEVAFLDGQLLINGKPLPEPYVVERASWFQRPVKMLKNQYYLVGDNRTMNIYEHEHGIVFRDEIMGKVLIGELREFDYTPYQQLRATKIKHKEE